MRLSVVFELLLVFLFLAFAAARVIDKKNVGNFNENAKKLRQGGPNRYCACTTNMCNCCRDFSLPVVPIKGPGCASIMYLKGDNMMISMSFGERVLSNMTIAGPKPKPVCMTLPGGISQFCGRIYGISRSEKNFKACLGLELRALDDIEAALRVSCFKFGPKGVNLESAPPIPPDENKKPDDEDDEDDEDDYDLDDDEDDDLIGLGGDLDDDEDDEDDDGPNAVASNEGNEVDSDSADYAGFSVLDDDFFGAFFNDEETRPKKKKKEPVKKTVKPASTLLRLSTTTRRPIFPIKRPTVRPSKVTRKPSNRITLIPRPSVNKFVSSPPTNSSASETISTTPLLPASIPPIIDPQVLTKPAVADAMMEENSHLFSTADKFLTTSPQPMSTLQTAQIQLSHNSQILNEASFTDLTTQKSSTMNDTSSTDEVKLPELDVEKIEAMAAIAQQGVTSSVIHSSALPPKELEKPPAESEIGEVNTEKLDLVPGFPAIIQGSPSKTTEHAENDRGDDDDDDDDDDDLLDGIIDDGLDGDAEGGINGSEEIEESQNQNEFATEVKPAKVPMNDSSENEKEDDKPTEVTADKSEEEGNDFFDGIIDDDDDDDDDDDKNRGDDEESENEKENPKEEEEEDILGAFVADSDENESEKEDSSEVIHNDADKVIDEESEEEDDDDDHDFLNVLGDDEEHDSSGEENDDENIKPTQNSKDKFKNDDKPVTEAIHTKTFNSTTLNDTGEANGGNEETNINVEETFNETAVANSTENRLINNNTTSSAIPEKNVIQRNISEIARYDKEHFVPLPKTDALLLMKAAAKIREPQVLKLTHFLAPPNKYLPHSNRPISSSRTHRRMNLDRWAPL